MLKGFRDFLMRGNVVDLAVAVIIGAAFGAIVNSLVANVINPLIAAIVGKPDFSYLFVTVHGGKIAYGNFLNAVLSFLLIATSVYFLIVLPMQHMLKRLKGPQAATSKTCPECLSEVPIPATRCKFCTQPIV